MIGTWIRLDPLERDDVPGLAAAAVDGSLWKSTVTVIPTPEKMPAFVEQRLADVGTGAWQAFTVRRLADDRIVGLTNYLHIDEVNRRREIGGTWYAASAQRSAVNSEAKLLLLDHAFGTLDCIAVELRTHSRNAASRAAIERLGARQDGILRHHMVMPDGSLRDTVVYSILAGEWPALRERLVARLAAR
ncbi:MAG TPA: GNAT family protein [Propionicimonas sp.]|uniref:GNAT family N-acetyltransferase n=1 Tax=Propionicimonas sp. TaxID=1955623 RepID=UPI002F3F8151